MSLPGVRYPAILGVGGWNDPRVVPWQPGKFVAAIQQASTSGRPALMLVNYDNGHFTEDKSVTYRNLPTNLRSRYGRLERRIISPNLGRRAKPVPAEPGDAIDDPTSQAAPPDTCSTNANCVIARNGGAGATLRRRPDYLAITTTCRFPYRF
jgi:Prolyl oligopeptidase family